MKEVVVMYPQSKADELRTSITLAGQTLGDQACTVTFVTSEEGFGRDADFVLPLTLLPAMVTGSRLKLPGKISSRLLSATSKLQDVFCLWDEESWFPPQRIPIDAEEVRDERPKRASGVACFFSGGVDSFYTLLKNCEEVTHLIFVHGFDITLMNASLREQASHAAREVARELGKSLIEISTDLRLFSDPLVDWGLYQGAALASVGLLFQHLFHKILIPSTFSYTELVPWGTHPLIDPLWSTELTEFEHDGCEAKRVDKVAYISNHEIAMKWLRICWMSPRDVYNCGRCGKCLMTMAALRAVGSLERCKTLPNTLDLRDIPKIDQSDMDGMALTRQTIKALDRAGTDPELTRALERSVRPHALYPKRRYALGSVLMDKTLKTPGVRRLARPAGPSIRLREVTDPGEWNVAVKALGGSITQSWEWGLFQQNMGWKPLRLLDEEGRGAIQLLLMEQRGGFCAAYAPYGPVATNTSDLLGIAEAAARRARECRAYFLKIEPRWSGELRQKMLETGLYVGVNRDLPGSTLIIDIPEDPDEHLRVLPEDTRSGVLRAHRQGVEVEMLSGMSLNREGVEEFLDLLEDTSKRWGFSFAPRGFYWHFMMCLPAYLLLARHEEKLIAGALIGTFGEEAYYFYGALSAEERDLCALDLVQWEAMDVARKVGCSTYDMWGIAHRPCPGDWARGADPSKERFGGTPSEYVGAHAKILSYLGFLGHGAIALGKKT